jgi:hypothetical protein
VQDAQPQGRGDGPEWAEIIGKPDFWKQEDIPERMTEGTSGVQCHVVGSGDISQVSIKRSGFPSSSRWSLGDSEKSLPP